MPRVVIPKPLSRRSAILACLILGSSGALAALGCGSDEAEVDNGGNASGSGNSGGARATGAGGTPSAAGAGGIPDEHTLDVDNPFPECSTGESWEPCGWSLSSEFIGSACTPGEQLQLGCCDCGEDAILRVCDGSTACSGRAQIGFNDDRCQLCPVVEFTCPASGVFSALTGTLPSHEGDRVPPPSACQPALVNVSEDAGSGSDAGTLGFDQIHPILVTNCARCHAEGGLRQLLALPQFASLDIEVAYEDAQRYANVVLAQISSGAMPPDSCTGRPPGSDGCVSAEDFELIRKWYIAGTPR